MAWSSWALLSFAVWLSSLFLSWSLAADAVALASFTAAAVSAAVVSASTFLPERAAASRTSSCWRYGIISSELYVSQNSRLALPWSNLRTRSGSLIPGISTMIRPCWPSSFWMLGCTTPNLSIRVRTTRNELSIADCTSSRNTFSTSLSLELGDTLPWSCCVAKISER